MKIMKVALLATAALAAVSISARADETSDLKAQLEALNARIAKLEAAPAVPVGFSLLTVSEGAAPVIPGLEEQDAASYGDKATVIGVLPAADVPATTEIAWSGFVRAAIEYDNYSDNIPFDGIGLGAGAGGDDDLDIRARGEIKVVAKTETAVGEVGVQMKFRANFQAADGRDINSNVVSPEYWGYWAMTPEWTLGAGFEGTLSNVPYGYDGFCACYYVDNSTAFDLNPNDTAQMRLSYASGPLSFAIALEDGSTQLGATPVAPATGPIVGTDDSMGVAARLKYDGDAFSAGISGGWWSKDDFAPGDKDGIEWQVGAGASFSLGDMATLSIGGAGGSFFSGADYWVISSGLSADLSETVNAQLGVGYKNFKSIYTDEFAVAGGVYWNPVDQLTIGLEGEYDNLLDTDDHKVTVDLVTVFRF
jgi:hypothetical protein